MITAQQKLFLKMPLDLLLDKQLPRSAVILMTVLIDLQDLNGCVDRTIEDLCRYTGLSEKTVRRSERELCDREIITITRTGRSSMIWIEGAYRSGSGYSALITSARKRRA